MIAVLLVLSYLKFANGNVGSTPQPRDGWVILALVMVVQALSSFLVAVDPIAIEGQAALNGISWVLLSLVVLRLGAASTTSTEPSTGPQ